METIREQDIVSARIEGATIALAEMKRRCREVLDQYINPPGSVTELCSFLDDIDTESVVKGNNPEAP